MGCNPCLSGSGLARVRVGALRGSEEGRATCGASPGMPSEGEYRLSGACEATRDGIRGGETAAAASSGHGRLLRASGRGALPAGQLRCVLA